MKRRVVSEIMMTLLLAGTLVLTSRIQTVSSEDSVSIEVPGTAGLLSPPDSWVNSGVQLSIGSNVSINASGSVSWDGYYWTGPDGAAWWPWMDNPVLPGAYVGALIAKVGDGSIFFVGSGPTTAVGEGTLIFAVNDNVGAHYNNLGSFQVTVVLQHDIAVTGISSAKTVIGQGYSSPVNVTVENQGQFAETFNLPLHAQLQSMTNETSVVGHWKFDEGTGATAHDSSGNGNDGIISGAAWTEGRFGVALEFDGVDDYVEVPDSASLNAASAITVCAWFKKYEPQTTDFPPIVKKAGDSSGYTLELHYWKFGSAVCIDGVWQGGTPPSYPYPLPFEWCHLAITYDGYKVITYANGVEISRKNVTGTITPTSNALYIGRCLTMSRFFNGTIDEAKVYNRSLSANEIWTEYARAPIAIQTQSTTLASHSSTTLIFIWNTTGFGKGNYTISAIADIVQNETDTVDNSYINGWVVVAMIGDIAGPTGWPDGKVDIRDIALVAKYFGQNVPPAPANCDITGPTIGVPDGKVDIRDIAIIAKRFGQVDP